MDKKAYPAMRRIFFLCPMVCLLFLTSGCGLDKYYLLPSPVNINHLAVYSSNYGERYFEFFTNESDFDSAGDFKFSGTEVYYKIYSSSQTLESQVAVLNNLASSDSTSATAASRLMTSTSSGGYGYRPLRVQNFLSRSTLIPFTGDNQRVYIRLSDYQSGEDFSARILVDGLPLYGSSSRTIPVRNIPGSHTFNFGREGGNRSRDMPESTDDDVHYTSMSDGQKWFVALFAVASGMDVTYTPYYSNILYLGAVTIDADTQDN